VQVRIVGGQHGHICRRGPGGGGADAALEGVVPVDVGGLLSGDVVLFFSFFSHNLLCFSWLTEWKWGVFGWKSGGAEQFYQVVE